MDSLIDKSYSPMVGGVPADTLEERERLMAEAQRPTENLMEDATVRAIKSFPLLSSADFGRISTLSMQIVCACPEDAADRDYASKMAAQAISGYRQHTRYSMAREKAEQLPVRKAAPSGEGGGRYYWRLLIHGSPRVMPTGDNGPTEVVESCVRHENKNKGDLALARRKAADAIAAGRNVVELIPPDYDPQQTEDEWTKNTSKPQPDGMTVRQRTKKH